MSEPGRTRRALSPHRLVAVLLAAAAPVAAQGWTALTPAASPPGRGGAAFGYDDARQVAVLFSGAQQTTAPPATVFRDTWEWNGVAWRQVPAAGPPSARVYAAMAYHPVRRRMVLFGGVDQTTGALLNDTWEYDGTRWRQVITPNAPSPRRTSLAWDPARGRVVLFGGDRWLQTPSFNDTWEYDGTTWTQSVGGAAPPAGPRPALYYDPARSVLVALVRSNAAQGRVETWERGPGGWTQRATARTPRIGGGTMAWDPVRQVCVYFDSHFVTSVFGVRIASTWEFNGVNWFDTTTSERPRALGEHATPLVYDRVLSTCVWFGGHPNFFPGTSSNTTWSYTQPTTYGANDPFGVGCPGGRGVDPLMIMKSIPSTGRTMEGLLINMPSQAGPAFFFFGLSNTTWPGGTLPLNLAPFGLTGCQLFVSPDSIATLPTFLGQLRLSFPVPNNAGLAGLPFFYQPLILDLAAPNGLGASAVAMAAVIGR